jgi:hypothetical protein
MPRLSHKVRYIVRDFQRDTDFCTQIKNLDKIRDRDYEKRS